VVVGVDIWEFAWVGVGSFLCEVGAACVFVGGVLFWGGGYGCRGWFLLVSVRWGLGGWFGGEVVWGWVLIGGWVWGCGLFCSDLGVFFVLVFWFSFVCCGFLFCGHWCVLCCGWFWLNLGCVGVCVLSGFFF